MPWAGCERWSWCKGAASSGQATTCFIRIDQGHAAERFARGPLFDTIERLNDCVFAIVITMLVLDVGVPALHDVHSVNELGRPLIGLLCS
jgi:hypothetical protein